MSKKPFSTKIDIKLKDKLKKDLENQNFAFTHPEHSIFSAKKKGIVCTLYKSGSLVVQGKEMDEFIEFYLEPEILKSFQYSNPLAYVDMDPRIGVDEAGKGDFFGSLCIASLFADKKGIEKLIDLKVQDSKRFSDSAILKLKKNLVKEFSCSIIIISPPKYNELYAKIKNLNLLLGWAHATAIENLFKKTKCKNVLIDQFAKKSIVANYVSKKKLPINLRQQHKAEEDLVVAGASILARAAFLENLEILGKKNNLKLLKGASEKVKMQGLKIAKAQGTQFLEKLCKKHFKTFREILKDL